jgi:hypothetical protein
VETYLLQENSSDATCMSADCKKPWIHEFLCANMTAAFMNRKYKKHREDVLYQIEVSFLPAAQIELEKEMRCKEIDDKIAVLKGRVRKLRLDKLALFEGKKGTEDRRVFIRACPATSCRGFLSTAWKCGLCKVNVCKDCLEIKAEAEHTCDPDTLKTAKMLSHDSKPCPTCACLIFKIDGCDQMFCTQCHTAFSWTTQKVEKGRVHNPHYYEWMRNNGGVPREPGDDPCGAAQQQIPMEYAFNSKFSKSVFRGMQQETHFYQIFRGLLHIQNVEMLRGHNNGQVDIESNMDLRKKYLTQEMDQAAFKMWIQRREKSRHKRTELINIYGMLVQVSSDHLWTLARATKTAFEKDLETFLETMEALRLYTNTCLLQMGKRFNCKSKMIDTTWQIATATATATAQ